MVKIKKYLTSHALNIFKSLLIILFLLPLINTSFIYLKTAINNLSYPYAILAGLEDENLARALMVLQGKSLYPPLTDYPFVVTLYPPVFFYLAALFVKTLGPTLFAGRVLSLICSLSVCLLCFMITWLLTKNIFWGVLAGLFFSVSGYVQWWGMMFKNDIMAVCFGLAGILLFLKYEKSKKYLLSVPFLILAVFTKQTTISAPLAVMAYLLLSKKRDMGKFFRFSFWFVGLSSLIFLFLTVATRGQFFIDIILVPRSIVWDFTNFMSYWRGTFYSYGFLLVPAIGFIVLERILYRETSLISWFFIFSVLARYDIGIIGSSDNYFMETVALVGIMAVLFFNSIFFASSLPIIPKKKKHWPDFSVPILLILATFFLSKQMPGIPKINYMMLVVALILFLLVKVTAVKVVKKTLINRENQNIFFGAIFSLMFLFLIWHRFVGMAFPLFPFPSFAFSPVPPSNLAPYQEQVDHLIRDNPGRVLVDSESFLAIKNNRDFEYVPMALKLRRQAGYWDFEKSKFFDDLGEQKFRFYIKSQGWTDPEILYKIYRHYKLTKIVDAVAFFYEIFEPAEGDYLEAVSEMRRVLDKAEVKNPHANEVFVKKIDKEKYLLGFTFSSDEFYGSAFLNIVNHPQFEALYRPLHSFHPDSSAIFRAKDVRAVKEIVTDIFAGPKYSLFLEKDIWTE